MFCGALVLEDAKKVLKKDTKTNLGSTNLKCVLQDLSEPSVNSGDFAVNLKEEDTVCRVSQSDFIE